MAVLSASATARSCVLKPLNPRHKTLHVSLTTTSERFRFGRRAECEASFPNDHRISGVHASLLLDGNHHFAIHEAKFKFCVSDNYPIACGVFRSAGIGLQGDLARLFR